jgi:uncharacterized membrane protein
MTQSLLKTVHLLSIIVWIGGMAFAHFFLRPAVAALEPPARLRLMHAVLGRFFGAVLVAAPLAVASGAAMLLALPAGTVVPTSWALMGVLGVIMLLIFLHVRVALYARLGRAVAAADWPAGALALGAIRRWVALNLGIGVAIVVLTLLGR